MRTYEPETNSQNPFFINKTSKSQDSEKNENKEDIFMQFNPFSQKIINALNINNPNIIPDTSSSKDKNSQKYINSGENFIITPDKNSQNNTNNKRKNTTNNKSNDNMKLNPFLVQKDNNNYGNNPYIKNTQLNASIISNINDNSNTSIFLSGTPLIKAENSISNNILALYDDKTNELNINNLNLMIENCNKQKDSIAKKNAATSTSINSNLDIIKEEQNESDKKSEQDLDANRNKINLSNNQNKLELLNSNYDYELISIDKLINEENFKEEDLKIKIKENYDIIDSSLENYNNNIINSIIETDINSFNNKINEFIKFSEQKVNKLKILDNICNRIKNEIIVMYDIMDKIENKNINEYKKIKEYESKLDYIISIQNKLIEELIKSNIQLKKNNKMENKEVIMTDEELNRNIKNTNSNLDKLNDIINQIFINNGKLLDFNNYKFNDFNHFEDNILFFEMLKNISKPLKDISNEYFKILLSIAQLKNK